MKVKTPRVVRGDSPARKRSAIRVKRAARTRWWFL